MWRDCIFREFTFFACRLCKLLFVNLVVFKMTHNVHALAMAGQFITFCRNVCPVNEQKAEIFILLLNRVFSARNYCQIANKKLMKCTSRPAIANANVGSSFSSTVVKNYHIFHQCFVCVVLLSRSLIVLSISFIRLSASFFVIPL